MAIWQRKNPVYNRESLLVSCSCGDTHFLKIGYFGDEVDSFYVTVEMNPYLPWYKRFVQAVRYVIGLETKWCSYKELVLDFEDAVEVSKFLTETMEKAHALESETV